jgi:hypothetical protein
VIKTRFPELMNELSRLQTVSYYASIRDVLENAERVISILELEVITATNNQVAVDEKIAKLQMRTKETEAAIKEVRQKMGEE